MKVLPILAVCFALAGCTDADWDNAMSYLPIEHGTTRTAETAAPPAAAASLPPADDYAARAASESVQAMPPSEAPASVDTESSPDRLAVSAAGDQHCRMVATQRATDGGYMGMSEDAQKEEYDRSYADCAAWDTAHGGYSGR